MKIKSEFLKYVVTHHWIIGGFAVIIIVGIILKVFTNWPLGDTIAILAVLSSMYIMLYNGHRTDYRFKTLIKETDKNTLRRIIGPERRKELIIFGEDLEVLYFKSQENKIPIELNALKLKNKEEVSDEFLEDFFEFLKYTAEKVTTHNLSSPLKILIYNRFIKLAENIDKPISQIDNNQREMLIELANEIYNEVVMELTNQKEEF